MTSYSTFFVCYIGPMVAASTKINLNNVANAIFIYLSQFTPDMVVNQPGVFLVLSVPVITLFVLAWISYLDRYLKNITTIWDLFGHMLFLSITDKAFFNVLLCKVLNKLTLFIEGNIYKIIGYLITMFVILNLYRQPIYIILGENIQNNFGLFLFVILSTIIPIKYTMDLIRKLYLTRKLDISFKLEDYRNITFGSIFLICVLAYISHTYIQPVLSVLFLIKSIGYVFNLDLHVANFFSPKSVNPIFNYRLLSKICKSPRLKWAVFPGWTLDEILDYYNTPPYNMQTQIGMVDALEPIHHPNNTVNHNIEYKPGRFTSYASFTKVLKSNAIHCANNIKVPLIPWAFTDSSFWHVNPINVRLSGQEEIGKDICTNIALHYFIRSSEFFATFGMPMNGGHLAGQRPHMEFTLSNTNAKHTTLAFNTYKDLPNYIRIIVIDCARLGFDSRFSTGGHFLIMVDGGRIAFAQYAPNYHDNLYRFKKGQSHQDISKLNCSGIIGLTVMRTGVEAIQQRNVYSPQLPWYTLKNANHGFSIHVMYHYLNLNKTPPIRDINTLVQVRNDNDFVTISDRLNMRLYKDGRLTRFV